MTQQTPSGTPIGIGTPATEDDLDAIRRQLGRLPRGVVAIAHRSASGEPDVVVTAPRLDDGTPFPTTFYATDPRLTGPLSTLESAGLMKEMNERLATDPDLAARYRAAHEHYLAARATLGEVPEIEGISAGGMPDRVKCLHVLAAHSLAAGPGVNPLGDATLEALAELLAGDRAADVAGGRPDDVAGDRAADVAGGRAPDAGERPTAVGGVGPADAPGFVPHA